MRARVWGSIRRIAMGLVVGGLLWSLANDARSRPAPRGEKKDRAKASSKKSVGKKATSSKEGRARGARVRRRISFPFLPMLRVRMPRTRSQPIFGQKALRGVPVRPRRSSQDRDEPSARRQRRLPTRPPERVRRVPLSSSSERQEGGAMITGSRRRMRGNAPSQAQAGQRVWLLVSRYDLARGGALRGWRGVILIEKGRLRFRCPLRSFCKVLRRHTLALLRKGIRDGKRRLKPTDPRFPWLLRRALERTHRYAVQTKVK